MTSPRVPEEKPVERKEKSVPMPFEPEEHPVEKPEPKKEPVPVDLENKCKIYYNLSSNYFEYSGQSSFISKYF